MEQKIPNWLKESKLAKDLYLNDSKNTLIDFYPHGKIPKNFEIFNLKTFKKVAWTGTKILNRMVNNIPF